MMPNFEVVNVTTDLLILGGGMASCGCAVEAAYWAKKNGLKVTLIDKAAMDRSGAVAMGLSALNQYVGISKGDNTAEQYVQYVRQDLMGITREDLVYNIARHVDSTVHLFEKWGLPIWKDAEGKYVHEGRWQVMINGESYKVIVAEAAKNALKEANGEYFERVFIVEPLMDGDRIAGAIGFSTRENKIYIFNAKATFCAMGGAVHVFRPRSVGEGAGRSWYPPFNSGSSAYFTPARRCGNDLPGSPLHPRAFQRRLRPGRRLVPSVQVRRHQRLRRKLHGEERRPTAKIRPLRLGEADPRLPA